ncbi:MAG: PepSY-associated TM helix domain-containing protein [Lysobacterales bacterium]
MIRKIFFWLHLSTGLLIGLVVAVMSATGVLLTYEHQILHWAERHHQLSPAQTDTQIAPEDLIEIARKEGLAVQEIVFSAARHLPVIASAGRRGPVLYIDQYAGVALGGPNAEMRAFFSAVTSWHRWLNMQGDARRNARQVTGVSNLAFAFLIVSGMYLWLPKLLRWSAIKPRILFQRRYHSSKARDFHWHHVLGIWAAIPLLVVVGTAVVFSFSWADELLSQLAPDSPAVLGNIDPSSPNFAERNQKPSLEQLLNTAKDFDPEWTSVTLKVPGANPEKIAFTVNTGSGRQPQHKTQIELEADTGRLIKRQAFADKAGVDKTWIFVRFLHTGEVYGVLGQTVAGLVSLISLFMVWTGLSLAWRRLIAPLFQGKIRRKA